MILPLVALAVAIVALLFAVAALCMAWPDPEEDRANPGSSTVTINPPREQPPNP